ncbi:MAG: GTP cyclohydrolase II [Acidobacteriota bacterium]|nr:MAG: GTP cyclohydrolase II [Acidobacteriota bacterium]
MSNISGKHDESGAPASAFEVDTRALFPSRYGSYQLVSFKRRAGSPQHASEQAPLALVRGDLHGADDVPTRLHSECLTGDALGSLRCDCRDQLEAALRRLAQEPRGVLLYLRQEGRGIGLANKIKAYALQDRGLDTAEANRALGFAEDLRSYDDAAAMLRALGVRSVRLMTNNPEKIEGLERAGIGVRGRIPMRFPPNPHNRAYLETKRRRFGHLV